MALLAEVLECEVRAVGAPQDGGVDGYVVRSDAIRSIVQVKWRQDTTKAESVSIVREVAGTLLAHGVPDGIIVSTRDHFSSAARDTAAKLERREITDIGKLRLQLVDYHLIMDMLDITTRKLTAELRAEEWFPMQAHDDCCVFDGASRRTLREFQP
jgi:restriction system protein